MSLAPGTRVGPYEILSPLGRGGMGEVWRARDTKLRREVAIKALPAQFAADPERRARFEREAHLLASLNHPNMAAIYGLEEAGDAVYLVLELVEGETLAERLVSGPLPVAEALTIAAQIASGLEAAHEAGVIHRDLKPSNVKVRPDGSVKVLDLGLARVIDPAALPTDASHSPTMTTGGTRSGVILGTAAYMSPEQARGRPLDKRTDIFSFGCVLFECLTGRVAFPGETVSDTLAAVLTAEPDWSALPASTPGRLSALVRRCLQKDRKQRLHDIADARIEIEEAVAAPTAEAASRPRVTARAPRSILWLLAAASIGAAAMLLFSRILGKPASPPVFPSLHATLSLPQGVRVEPRRSQMLAFSPDGRTLVFRAVQGDGVARLYRRSLDEIQAEPIAGTEGAFSPFFSPDSQWLAFFTLSTLKKVPAAGGSAISICQVPPITDGGTWTEDGWIVFSRTTNGELFRVREGGGAAEPFDRLEPSRGEHAHLRPQSLPGGRGILAAIVRGKDFQDIAAAEIAVLEPGGKRRVLLEGSAYARYAAGHLTFLRGEKVFTAPFDLSRLQITGPPSLLPEPVTVHVALGMPYLAVSNDGLLAYLSGPPVRELSSQVLQIDRSGRETDLGLPAGSYDHVALSPDGRRMALGQWDGRAMRLVVFDRERRVLSPLTPEPGRTFCPVWSPDGKRIAFSFFETGNPKLAIKEVDGSGGRTILTNSNGMAEFPNTWSPDGKVLAYTVDYEQAATSSRPLGTTDIWILPSDGKSPPHPWFESPFREISSEFSPDGQWIVYVSDESGRQEVYLRPFPGPGGRIQISSGGGNEPRWAGAGKEIVYRQEDKFLAVPFRPAPEPAAGTPRVLFSTRLQHGGREDWPWEYDLDRKTGAVIGIRPESAPDPLRTLVLVTGGAESRAGLASAR